MTEMRLLFVTFINPSDPAYRSLRADKNPQKVSLLRQKVPILGIKVTIIDPILDTFEQVPHF